MGLIDKLKGAFHAKNAEPQQVFLSKIYANGYYRISTPEKRENNQNYADADIVRVAKQASILYPNDVLVISVGSAASRISVEDYQKFKRLYEQLRPGKNCRITQDAWIMLNNRDTVVDRIDRYLS
jgi:hypothetical protein